VKKGYLIVLSLMLIPLWTVVAYAIDPNLIAHWTMDNLDVNSFQNCTITGTVSPDILCSSGVLAGSYNGKNYYSFNVTGWQIKNDTQARLPSYANYSAGNIVYDSVTAKYWWALQNMYDGAIYLASSSTLPGTWTIETGAIAAGGRPYLIKFGSTWYLYYDISTAIHVRTATAIGGPYSGAIVLLQPGADGSFDDVWVKEACVIYSDPCYYMFYMGTNNTYPLPNCYEKIGYATCSTPTGTFVRYAGNPVLSGGSQTTGNWDDGNVRAADPHLFKLDPCSSTWYIGVSAGQITFDNYHVGYFRTDDFVTFTEVSTFNPLLDTGGEGAWDENGAWRGGPPVTYNGQMYIPYMGKDSDGHPMYSCGLAILTVDPVWYMWWDGVNSWILSPTLGVKGTRYWSLTTSNPLGGYTAAGTATGTATTADHVVPDETGNHNGTSASSTTYIAVTGRINGGVSLGTGQYIAIGAFTDPIKSFAMWIKPTDLIHTGYLIKLSSSIYIQLVNAVITPHGFSSEKIIYVDGQVSATIPNDGGWHHIAVTDTTGYTSTAATIDASFGGYKGSVDDVGVWNRALVAGDIYDPNPGTINYVRLNGISGAAYGTACNPNPYNMQRDVAVNTMLSWRPGDCAADVNGHDVYFGTNFADVESGRSRLVSDMDGDGQVNFTELGVLCEQWLGYVEGSEPQADLNGDKAVDLIDFAIMADEWEESIVYKGRQSANRYDPCNLEFGVTYFWRVDEVNDSNVWSGNVWQFTTRSGSAGEPVPANNTNNVNTNIELKWRPGDRASDVNGHDVYIGTDFNAVEDGDANCYKGRQDANNYTPTDLNFGTTYYWRIDEFNDSNVWTGDVWSFTTKAEGALPTLANAPTALTIPTYDGSGQAMHPSVVYFPDGWNGYKYWMAMTPLPYDNEDFENPSIVASNDNLSWEVPPGLTNPLIFKPPPWGSYNADPELVYNDDTNELWLYFLRYWSDIGQNKLGLMKSGDGVNWTEPEYLLTWDCFPHDEGSYAIIKQGNEWHYWAENADAPQDIVYRYSTDGENWSEHQNVEFSPVPSSLPWHLDVIYVPAKSEYLMLFSAPGDVMGSSLFFAKSTDRIHWTFYTNEVLAPSGAGWDNGQLYRPTILYDSDRQMLRIWYSASDSFYKWGTGYTETNY
jgi:hypothetical protein